MDVVGLMKIWKCEGKRIVGVGDLSSVPTGPWQMGKLKDWNQSELYCRMFRIFILNNFYLMQRFLWAEILSSQAL